MVTIIVDRIHRECIVKMKNYFLCFQFQFPARSSDGLMNYSIKRPNIECASMIVLLATIFYSEEMMKKRFSRKFCSLIHHHAIGYYTIYTCIEFQKRVPNGLRHLVW